MARKRRRKPEPIGATLRKSIERSEHSLYRIAQEAGVDYAVLHRFAHGTRSLRIESAERLAAYFDLELKPRD